MINGKYERVIESTYGEFNTLIYIEFLNLSIQIATQQTKLKGGFNNECVAIVWGDYWKSMHPLVAHGKWDTFK